MPRMLVEHSEAVPHFRVRVQNRGKVVMIMYNISFYRVIPLPRITPYLGRVRVKAAVN